MNQGGHLAKIIEYHCRAEERRSIRRRRKGGRGLAPRLLRLPVAVPAPSRAYSRPIGTPVQQSRALIPIRSGRGDLRCQPPPQPQPHDNLGSMLRRDHLHGEEAQRQEPPPAPPAIVVPAKNGGGGGGKLPGLSRKLFQKGPSEGRRKALTEVKNSSNTNTRTLAMVLRSERELLTQSKEQEDEIDALHLQLQQDTKLCTI